MNTKSQSFKFLVLHSPTLSQHLFACIILAAILLIFKFQAFSNLATLALGGAYADAGLYLFLAEKIVANFRDSLIFLDTGSFYPYGLSLAYSDNFIIPSLLIFVMTKLAAVDFLIAYNLTILGAIFLSGYLSWLLAFNLGGSWLAALYAGAIFQSLAYLSLHLGHVQLQFSLFLPLVSICIFRYLAYKNSFYSFLAALSISLAFYTTVYYSIFAVLIVATFILATILLRPNHLKLKNYVSFAFSIFLGLLPILAILPSYIEVREVFGARGLHEPYYFAATFSSFFSAPPTSLLYSFTSSFSTVENRFFLGFVGLALAFFASLHLRGHRRINLAYLYFITVFIIAACLSLFSFDNRVIEFILSLTLWLLLASMLYLGLTLSKLERRLKANYLTNRSIIFLWLSLAVLCFCLSFGPLGLPHKYQFAVAPHRIFFDFFPGFDSLRAIGRIGLVTIFALIQLSAFWLAVSKSRVKKYLPIFIILALIEQKQSAIPLEAPPVKSTSLKTSSLLTRGLAVVVYPLTKTLNSESNVASWTEYSYYTTENLLKYSSWGLALANGYSGQRTKLQKELPRKMSGFPDQRSLNTLSNIAGLGLVLLNSSRLSEQELTKLLSDIKNYPESIKIIETLENGDILLEVKHQRAWEDSTSILVPSFRPGILSLEIKFSTPGQQDLVPISIFTQIDGQDLLLATNVVKPTKDWQWISFLVQAPSQADQVRPLAIKLDLAKDIKLNWRASRFEYLE